MMAFLDFFFIPGQEEQTESAEESKYTVHLSAITQSTETMLKGPLTPPKARTLRCSGFKTGSAV